MKCDESEMGIVMKNVVIVCDCVNCESCGISCPSTAYFITGDLSSEKLQLIITFFVL